MIRYHIFWKLSALTMTQVALSLTTSLAGAQSFTLVHTFDDPTPTQIAVSGPGPGDEFGFSLALDGDHVLIGARADDTNGADVGQAHLFDASTGELVRTFNDPTPTDQDNFGESVALEDNLVLVGASGDGTNGFRTGQAYLFDATTGDLLHTFNDPTTNGACCNKFGRSVTLNANRVLIGEVGAIPAGEAHLFDISGNLLQTFDTPSPINESDALGNSVALHENRALIGNWRDDTFGTGVGQAYLFDATAGAAQHTFNDPTPTVSDRFGYSVAVDGSYVLIGAPGDDTNGVDVGQVHLFDTSGDLLWTFNDPTPTDRDGFGWGVTLDGNHVLISDPGDDTNGDGVGQAHLFDVNGNLLWTFNNPVPASGDVFGWNLALDGNRVLLGAISDDTAGEDVGQAYLFEMVVPEPSGLALLASVFSGMLLLHRRVPGVREYCIRN